MSRFRRPSREVPGLNLASLPDLIFTVLFFFMIVTHMRQLTPQVRYEVPQGTEIGKDVSKSGLISILIGHPVDTQGNETGQETRIQINDQLVRIDQIEAAIEEARSQMSDDERQHLTVSIRADRQTEMGVINDVKQALRRAGALNINYSATEKNTRNKKD